MLLAGVVLAWFGGEFFVRGGVGLARWLRWPSAVIGVTVAAFGTSSPELLVAIHAALDGVPQISLGDVLGSNVVNVALVLAIVLALSGMKAEDGGVRRDWLISLLVPGVVYALLMDGWFSRVDAAIMLGCFFAWLIVVIRHARRHAASAQQPTEPVSASKTILATLLGLGLLIVAAQLVVNGGKGVAQALGWSPFIVGAVVVAAATSTPELATTLIARARGQSRCRTGQHPRQQHLQRLLHRGGGGDDPALPGPVAGSPAQPRLRRSGSASDHSRSQWHSRPFARVCPAHCLRGLHRDHGAADGQGASMRRKAPQQRPCRSRPAG